MLRVANYTNFGILKVSPLSGRMGGMYPSKEKPFNIYRSRVKTKEYRGRYYRETKLKVMKHYGGNPPKCACCGEDHLEFLQVDHINNDGAEHRRREGITGGIEIERWLIKNNYPDGFQILCANCNIAKAHYEECPHQNLPSPKS